MMFLGIMYVGGGKGKLQRPHEEHLLRVQGTYILQWYAEPSVNKRREERHIGKLALITHEL